jgi:probable HAF family extracellular repeat protein
MMELSDPYYVGGDALAVSADGSVVVGRTIDPDYFGYHAFRWTQSTGMITLLPPNAPVWDTEAFAVSADGSIIVGTYSDNVWSGAFIWDAVNGIRSLRDLLVNQLHLDLTGWTSLGTATGISADGLTVVGTGSKNTPSFHQEAWIATSPNPPRRFSC